MRGRSPRVTLMAASFEDTLSIVRQGDFVYLDPPYCIRSRRVFNEYSNAAFGSEQLRALRGHLDRLDQMGVEFLVSYGHSSEALELDVDSIAVRWLFNVKLLVSLRTGGNRGKS